MSGSGIDGTGAIINTGGNSLNAFDRVTLAGDTVFGEGRYDIRSQATNNVGLFDVLAPGSSN